MGQPYINQQSYRWRDDSTGPNVDSGWAEAKNTALGTVTTVVLDTNYRIRFAEENSGAKDLTSTRELWYSVNSGEWFQVTLTSAYVRIFPTSQYDDQDPVTDSPARLESGTYDEGYCDEDGEIASFTLAQGPQESENEWCIQFRSADITGAESIELQMQHAGGVYDNYTNSPTTIMPSPPAHTIEQGSWRWYDDVTPDSSKTPYTTENNWFRLLETESPNSTILRLRVQLIEVDGNPGAGTIQLQWAQGTEWLDIGPQSTNYDNWISWADGADIVGNTITSQLVADTDASGKYHEATALSESVAANATQEIDCAIIVRWPPPDTMLKFRVVYNGSPIPLNDGETVIKLLAWSPVDRGYAVGSINSESDGSGPTELYGSNRVFFDGTYWWCFHSDPNLAQINYYYWDGSGAWSAKQTKVMTSVADKSENSFHLKIISGTPVVMCMWHRTSGYDYIRGTISGTTITWGSQTPITSTEYGNRISVGIDDGNYWWFFGPQAGVGVWAYRATNADAGSSWTPGLGSRLTVADTDVGDNPRSRIIGLASNKAMAIWYSFSVSDLKWSTVTGSGFDGVGTLNATADANDDDWGVARGGGYVYCVHTDNTENSGNWILRVFDESGSSWATGTSPNVSGQGTSHDTLGVTYDGAEDGIYAIGNFTNGLHRVIRYKYYTGGASGTWDGTLTDLSALDNTGNSDEFSMAPDIADGKLMCVSCHGDPGLDYTSRALEFQFELLGDTVDDLDAVGITTTPVTGTPSIGQTHVLSATGITTNPVLGTPTVSEIINLTAVGITTIPVFDTPTLTRIPNLTAVDISANPVLGTPSIGQTHVLDAVDITANPALDTPSIGQTHVLDAVDITANPVLGTPILGQTHPLDAVGINTNPVLDTPALAQVHVLDGVGITANPVLDTPSIGQIHALDAVDTTTTPITGTPTLAEQGEDNLIAVGITTTPVTGTPTIGQTHVLDVVDITTTPVMGVPTAGHIHVLDAVGITTTPVTGVPTAGHIHVLDAVNITVTPVLDTPSIGQTHVLDAVDITTTPVLGTPTLSTEGIDNLVANDITTTPVTGTPAIGQTHSLSATGIITTPVLDTPTISIIHILDATSIETIPVVGTPAIGQTHALSSTGIVTTPEVGTPILGQSHILDASGFITTPVLEVPTIGQIHVLDAVTIVVSPILGVPLVGQTHILDGVGITTTPEMGVASFELVDGKIVIVFSAYQPELDFSAYQPELDFGAYQPELDFTIVYTED